MLRQMIYASLLTAILCGMTGCYQVHSDDDLRTVPVTNNPNILPKSGSPAALPSPKI